MNNNNDLNTNSENNESVFIKHSKLFITIFSVLMLGLLVIVGLNMKPSSSDMELKILKQLAKEQGDNTPTFVKQDVTGISFNSKKDSKGKTVPTIKIKNDFQDFNGNVDDVLIVSDFVLLPEIRFSSLQLEPISHENLLNNKKLKKMIEKYTNVPLEETLKKGTKKMSPEELNIKTYIEGYTFNYGATLKIPVDYEEEYRKKGYIK